MDPSFVELNQKLDALTAQVAYLTDQTQIAERERQGRAELMHDLTPIANEAFRLTVEQLEQVQEYVDLGDLLRLLKRLLRNGRNLDKMLDQLESVADLADTVGPLADEAFGKAVGMLAEMEHKGYFGFAKSGVRIVDNVVTSFTEEDVNRLGDNIVLILNTVKDMTNEIMSFLRTTLLVAEREDGSPWTFPIGACCARCEDGGAPRSGPDPARMHVIGAQAGNGHYRQPVRRGRWRHRRVSEDRITTPSYFSRRIKMTTRTIAGKTVQVNDEGL
jgi:hypothetical protein